MNKIYSRVIVIAAILLSAGVVSLNAQVSQRYRAEVPFAFHARGTAFDAGTYKLGSLTNTPNALSIMDRKTGKLVILGLSQARNDDPGKPGKMTFEKVNGAYHLIGIRTSDFEIGFKKTRTAVKQLAGQTSKPEIVVINLMTE